MLVSGDDDYAMVRAAQVLYDALKHRGVLKGVIPVYLDIQRYIKHLQDGQNGYWTGSAGWTITRRYFEDGDGTEDGYYISIDVAEVFDNKESYNYVSTPGPYEYYKTPLIAAEDQVP